MSDHTDWKGLSRARGLNIPEADVAAIAARLDALEEALRQLARDLTPDQDPALLFRADPETE